MSFSFFGYRLLCGIPQAARTNQQIISVQRDDKGPNSMTKVSVNAAARLDRLPISPFHRRVLLLIGAGTFFDSFDVYLGGSVIAAPLKEGWSTLDENALFLSATFFGMAIGAWVAGIMCDKFGRRFSFQFNLAIFGLASFAAALAPSMTWLIV